MNFTFYNYFLFLDLYFSNECDKTDHKLSRVRRAYQLLSADRWDKNIVNNKYVIAYEIHPGLDIAVKVLIPEVIINNFYSFVDRFDNEHISLSEKK